MKKYGEMTKEELAEELGVLRKTLKEYGDRKLKLNMARGKPGQEQLALSMPLLDVVNSSSDLNSEDGVDCRNYGELSGIADAKKLFGDLAGVAADEIFIAGSSSLTFMYDCVTRAMLTGVPGSEKPWSAYPKVKFICLVPGYDRHFSICEFLGIEMINVPLYESGPDMDMVEEIAASDESVKGMWCVPKYTNPMGTTYSDDTVRRLAVMKTAAADFRLLWDNAYCVHYIYRDVPLLNILDECKKAGNPNRPYIFGSTSKITFPGAGVGFFAASKENMDFAKKQLAQQAIGWDKINMLRHARFFKNAEGVMNHMKKHAEILRPRFDAVVDALEKELAPRGVGKYIKPEGGYFIAYMAEEGCAKRTVELCKESGVTMTPAGATHPYGRDEKDSFIRIAPSFPSPDELKSAMEIFCVAARIAAAEKLAG